MPRSTGVLLAAGAGRRYGGPKALVVSDGDSWVVRAATALLQGGCDDVVVVTGARAEEVEQLLTGMAGVATVRCGTWEAGMADSLGAGLMALVGRGRLVPVTALVHLVDLPDVGPEVVARVLEQARGADSLARATYRGRPGHPVLLGQLHWDPVLQEAAGEDGARRYLRRARPLLVECGDLATGQDVDQPG